jgi:molybdopterin molybdotransferase
MIEPDVSQLITVSQAIVILDAVKVTPRMVRIDLAQAEGLRLAEPLRADRDSPPFDKVLMDGYAVRSADLANLPKELHLRGRTVAGQAAKEAIFGGQTIAVTTGAPLPPGADAVVPLEDTELVAGTDRVRFLRVTAPGKCIARRASEEKAKSIVLPAGARLGPAQLAVAASIGAARPAVFAAPSVAVVGSGDELVAIDQTPKGAQIRSSNNLMLAAQLRRWNCRVTDLGTAPDDPAAIREKIVAGLREDVLVISGGMSVGERDFVPQILHDLGAEMLITKLRIKPGKPFVFARMKDGQFIFGLPGNPVSAFVCMACLGRRLLDRIAGGTGQIPRRMAALGEALDANSSREFYQPAIFDGRAILPLAWKGSADIYTLARANALIVRPENHPPQPAGAAVDFLEI